MPELNKAKQIIEDWIPEYLDGELRKSALDFVVWLRANNMKPVCSSWGIFKASYKGKVICTIKLPNTDFHRQQRRSWAVALHLNHADEYKELVVNEGLEYVFFDNVVYCAFSNGQSGIGCHQNKPCAGGKPKTILGKELKGVCCNQGYNMPVFNPDETAKNGIKRLLKLEQKARNEAPRETIKKADVDVQKSEQNEKSSVEKPVFARREIEDVACKLLESGKQKNLLDFVAWLRANKMPPVWDCEQRWKSSYKGQRVCYVHIGHIDDITNGYWGIKPFNDNLEDASIIANERLKEIALSNLRTCKNCGSCFGGYNKTIFGKKIDNVCAAGIEFWNPGADEIECVKQLILARRDYEARVTR